MKARVKDWEDHQHYKDRTPPWIKLHRSLLDDFSWHCLPVASKAIAPMLWLLASEKNGWVNIDPDFLAFRLRMTPSEVEKATKPLIDNGWLTLAQDASAPQAERNQDACLETEAETEERKDITPIEERFQAWYSTYPRKVERKAAYRAFKKLRPDDELLAQMIQAVEAQKAWRERMQAADQFVPEWKHPATWLNKGCWDDELYEPGGPAVSWSGILDRIAQGSTDVPDPVARRVLEKHGPELGKLDERFVRSRFEELYREERAA